MTESPEGQPIDAPAALRLWLRHFEVVYGADLAIRPAGRLRPANRASPGASAPGPSAPPGVASPPSDAAAAATPQPAPAPEIAPAELPTDLDGLRSCAVDCSRCGLAATRRNVVFGEGSPQAEVLFIGEAPGAREDATGRPFVGRAGELLDRILSGAMGLQREDIYIANVNKCRPPGNRDPEPDEIAACLPFLRGQVEAIRPKVLVTLGRIAAQNLLGTTESMTRLRGRDLEYAGIPVVATWHPAYLLRNPAAKVETWQDIKRVNRLLGRPEDPRQAGGAE